MKIFAAIICFISFELIGYSQVTQEWIAKYTGSVLGSDYSRVMAQDENGNIYCAGSTYEGPPNDNDILLIKYNSSGVQQWIRKYNGSGNNDDNAVSVALDSSGNIYVGGYIRGSGSATDYILLKYTPEGDTVWTRTYNGTGNFIDYSRNIAVDRNQNVVIAGYSAASKDNYDYLTIKYDSAGNQIWLRRFNSPANDIDECYSMKIDDNGNIYLTGQSIGIGSGLDALTIKYDSAGVEIWNRRFNLSGTSSEVGYNIAINQTGDVFITGSATLNAGIGDMLTLKYNAQGTLLWAKTYNGTANDYDYGIDILADSLGNVYTLGETANINTGSDIILLKYSPTGDTLWRRMYSTAGNNDDSPAAITTDKSNNIYVTGGSFIDNAGFTTQKYNAQGTLIWTIFYNGTGPGADISADILVDDNFNVFITGCSIENGTLGDATTVKYSQPIGIINISETANTYELFQNYPNPFNPSTKITFSLPKAGNVRLFVYNVNGQLVSKLVNDELKHAGVYEIEFNGILFGSGVYFYKLESGDYSLTKKMILVK